MQWFSPWSDKFHLWDTKLQDFNHLYLCFLIHWLNALQFKNVKEPLPLSSLDNFKFRVILETLKLCLKWQSTKSTIFKDLLQTNVIYTPFIKSAIPSFIQEAWELQVLKSCSSKVAQMP